MSIIDRNVPDKLSHAFNIIPQPIFDALLQLNEKLDGKTIKWTITGDLGEALRVVKVDPDCVEILATSEDAERILEAVEAYQPKKGEIKVQKLDRNANIQGEEYPVSIRSYYFDFNIGAVPVRVYGDLQYKINDWDWGDKLEFTPDYTYIVGKKTALVPLPVKLELYQMLGWTDRSEKIQQALPRLPTGSQVISPNAHNER